MRTAWLRRTVRFRITSMATVATLVILLGLAWFSGGRIGSLLIDSADRELGPILQAAIVDVSAGRAPRPDTPYVQVRVLDTAGVPVDGQAPPELGDREVSELKAGEPILRPRDDPPTRWVGTVVTAPDGAQRLVIAGTGLAGYTQAQRHGTNWLLLAAALGAVATGIATWFSVRSTLRPVERMRLAAIRLPAGQRLPLPDSDDELRSLAGALNGLLERRDEAAARLRKFTGDAAHELRSPVASIRVQAEVAVANPDPDLSQEVLSDIVKEAERLSTLVDGLLALARSDAGELPAAQPVDLVAAAQTALVRCGCVQPRVILQAPTGQAWVQAAPTEVDLVLDNLLRNAVLYARAQVTVSVLPAGGSARLVVDDDGPGIALEHREKVFDRFYRVQDDRARQTGGSGLGLALVAELVLRRGGTVLVSESPDGGARFQVRWKSL